MEQHGSGKRQDQADTLRRLMHGRVAIRPQTFKPIRVISVTSGKGGVGKTNIVANLAVLLQRLGHKVLVLDGDFGLANLNIVMGLEPKGTLYDVLEGTKTIEEVMLTGPGGIRVIPASSGIFKMTQLSMAEKAILMERLEQSPFSFDVLLIDTGAGINSDVTYLNSAATEVIVVATPEPTSIADAYALMKVMSQDYRVKRFKLLVNMVANPKEGLGVYNNILNVADRFLNISIEYLGHVLDDRKISQAVLSRKVACESYPTSLAVRCLETTAKSLIDTPAKGELTGNVQFFWRTLLKEDETSAVDRREL
ncbi:MAG TPA: MinD/ParA family protein [Oligoflexia bacterium]|nr:MinD/ParA family protein [Oligoflexia bacterium]